MIERQVEVLERRRMQNRLAQRKRRQRRALHDQEQHEREQQRESQNQRQVTQHDEVPRHPVTRPIESGSHGQQTNKLSHSEIQEPRTHEEQSLLGNMIGEPFPLDQPQSQPALFHQEDPEDWLSQTTIPSQGATVLHFSTLEQQTCNTPYMVEDYFLNSDIGLPGLCDGDGTSNMPSPLLEPNRVLPTGPVELKTPELLSRRSQIQKASNASMKIVSNQFGQSGVPPVIVSDDKRCYETTQRVKKPPPAQLVTPPTQSTGEICKGKMTLHMCAEKGHSKIVRFLLSYGAEVDALDGFGRTALHYAARNDRVEVVTVLLAMGADTEVTDHNGFSPLHIAADAGCEDVIRVLVKEGADLNARIGITKEGE